MNQELIQRVNKVYELKKGPLGFIRQYQLPHNTILNLIQHLIIKNQLHSSILYKW